MREYDLSTAQWRKSSYSDGNGGSCVEVAYNFVGAAWRKSSHSDGDGGNCLEVLDNAPGGVVPVRDSKNPAGPALVIAAPAWAVFVAGVRKG
ncbi:DUF397 domain-containing protein [Streptomyces sp. NPDC014870]|uniref:DUF397 domain-containing protein n=1 Tax=Streptomyces sp. NPDC014870 TaxID=3364925 RepID=UPI0036FE7855